MKPGPNGTRGSERVTLIEAAQTMERLEGRAAHARELEALRVARNALLTIVSEGFVTLDARLRDGGYHGATGDARDQGATPRNGSAAVPARPIGVGPDNAAGD